MPVPQHEGGWPISRNAVITALSFNGIPPRNRPTGVTFIGGSDVYGWCRFEAPFSRLVVDDLPMIVDPQTGDYMEDEKRLARAIGRAFIEHVSDVFVERRGKWHYIATFTLYTSTKRGRESFKRRVIEKGKSWEVWSADNTF